MQNIEDILNKSHVVLFMKGTPQQPYCNFSRVAVLILQSMEIDFFSVNILEDEALRSDIKVYANWPTFPMLFVKKELIGGVDIMTELMKNDELESILSEFKKRNV